MPRQWECNGGDGQGAVSALDSGRADPPRQSSPTVPAPAKVLPLSVWASLIRALWGRGGCIGPYRVKRTHWSVVPPGAGDAGLQDPFNKSSGRCVAPRESLFPNGGSARHLQRGVRPAPRAVTH